MHVALFCHLKILDTIFGLAEYLFIKVRVLSTRPTPTLGPKRDQLVVTSPMTRLLKIQYLSHFRSKNFQIALVKSYSVSNFKKHKKCGKFQLILSFKLNKISVKELFNIPWLPTIGCNIMKPTQCTPNSNSSRAFPWLPREWQEVLGFGRSQCDK